jgi:hypothetical protein
MRQTPRDATLVLLSLQQSQNLCRRYSSNNGVILLVWAASFVVDMVGFDMGRWLHSYLFGPLAITIINSLVLGWRIWYARQLPIRPRCPLTNRAIFLWGCYITALLVGGLVGWGLLFATYPPCWFTLLGLLGTLPLAIRGMQLFRLAHR